MATRIISSNVYIARKGTYSNAQLFSKMTKLTLDASGYFNPKAYTFPSPVEKHQNADAQKLLHQDIKKIKRKNPLTKRLSRMVTELQAEENREFTNIPGFKFVNGKDHNFLLRFMWLVIIILNVGLCVFQIYDRIAYYFSNPVATDFRIIRADEWPAPAITLCSTDTDEVIQIRKAYKTLQTEKPNMVDCSGQQMKVLDLQQLTFEEKWNVFNVSKLIKYREVQSQNIQDAKTLHSLTTEFGNTIYGICTTFRSPKPLPIGKGEMKMGFAIATDSCAGGIVTGTSQAEDESSDYMNSFMFGLGINIKLELEAKMYQFVNIPREPCVTINEYRECKKQCILRYYKEKVICSFPFVDPEATKLPSCNNLMANEANLNVSDIYGEAMNSFLNVDLSKCGCYRACTQNEYMLRPIEYEFFNNDTAIFVKFIPHGFPWIVQRLPYDLTSLLCDIGGNLGLYLGWSILSIFEFMQLMKTDSQIRPHFNALTDPLYRKVCKVYKQVAVEKAIDRSCRFNLRFKQLLHVIVTIFCLTFFIYQVQDRTRNFFAYPVVRNVEIEVRPKVTFPVISTCTWTMKTRTDRKALVVAKSIGPDEITFYDLFDSKAKEKENTAQIIWNRSNNGHEIITLTDLSQDMISVIGKYKDSLLQESKDKKFVDLPIGKCTQVTIGTHFHKGSNTVHMTLWKAREIIPGELRYVYINSEDEEIDITSPIIYPTNVSLISRFSVQETRRWNSPNSYCVSTAEAISCRHNCISQVLLKTLPCNLPYMQNNTLKNCKTKEEAVRANKVYLDFLSTPLPSQCNCHPQCNKIIFRVTIVVLVPGNMGLDVSLSGFATNIAEIFTESSAYSIIKYLCDVGSNLGLALGYSILHVFALLTTLGKNIFLRFSSFGIQQHK